MKCKYSDCGWCYSPPMANSNDENGQCNNPGKCEAFKEDKKDVKNED